MLFINLIPIFIILGLLFWRKHMLLAGVVGAAIAMIIAWITMDEGITLAQANSTTMGGIGTLLGFTTPLLYAATATMLGKAGCFKSAVVGLKRVLKGKLAILAAFIVIIQAFATYMAGMGAGNTMVIAPLLAAVVGAVPQVIAGMAIATAVCFVTSPASTETILAAGAAGFPEYEVAYFSNIMMPFTIIVVLAGAGLAFYGVYKNGSLLVNEKDETGEDMDSIPTGKLFTRGIPAIVMLALVVFSSVVNRAIGTPIIVPVLAVIVVSILTVIFTPFKMNEVCANIIDGSRFILTTLFGVGLFLGFINIIALTGVFEDLAALVGTVPQAIVLPSAMVLAFLIAIPSGAFAAGVLALILPTLSLLGFSPIAMGFIAISTAFGTQISPVQINVVALSQCFGKDIMWVVKSNLRFIVSAFAVLIVVSFFVA